MKQDMAALLTAKDDKAAYAAAMEITAESMESDQWYEFFDFFAALLDHPKSYVRNRVFSILAANAQWDDDHRFDAVIDAFLSHITDEKPITARQCIKALAQLGCSQPRYIPKILSAMHSADLSKYKDTMRPLIEKDMTETERILSAQAGEKGRKHDT